jgi:hydrogenase maturation protein HypF
LWQQLERGINTVPTSSIGRLFDAVSSLIGLRHEIQFEAQAAIELQTLAVPGDAHYCFDYRDNLIDPKPLLKAIIADMRSGISQALIAGRFHKAIVALIVEIADKYPQSVLALSGGVFQNACLSSMLRKSLLERGCDALFHQTVPTTDAGLALGQAAILAHQRILPD